MIDHDDEEEEESARQRARAERHQRGRKSAALAHTLMSLSDSLLKGIEMDQEVRDAVQRARSITSRGGRRREERRLAGELRLIDYTELDAQLLLLEESGRADARMFQLAESWRARMIEEPSADQAFQAEYPGLDMQRWQALISDAQRERRVGKPKGSAKTLFRAIMTVLRTRKSEDD